jgi:LuxR family transcriptional regulator, maltose regulon positive regulatory protein
MFIGTKFQPPPSRREHVRRDRCLLKISGPLAAAHLLISAPAGAGKSTFAAQWAARFQLAAWVSLTDEDNEPTRFWSAFIAALAGVSAGMGVAMGNPVVAGGAISGELVALVDELASLTEPLAIVLDDLHLITDEGCVEQLGWLLNNAPWPLQIAMCTRAEPPLMLDRLVAHGELAVIRGPDLLFDRDEADEFLRERLALDLDQSAVDTIVQRTEGWPAGLFLTALAVRNGATATAIPEGGDRQVRSYLDAEVLASVDETRLLFLEEVSVFERFSAAMCDTVLGRDDSTDIIEQLERRNLFVIPLDSDGTWFRLHHLFAEFMRERLEARLPGKPAELYGRIARWHVGHEEIPEAVTALIRGGDPGGAGELVARYQARYITMSRFGATVERWLDLLPEDLVATSAPLNLTRAWVAGLSGRSAEMDQWIRRAQRHDFIGPLPDGSASVDAQVELLRACFGSADRGACLRHARRAVELDGERSPWRPVATFVAGFWSYLTEGPTAQTIDELVTAERSVLGQPEHVLVAVCAPAVLAAAYAERHEPLRASAAIERAESARAGLVVQRVPQAAISWWATARARLLLGDIEEAVADAEAAVSVTSDIAPEWDSTMVVPACLIHLARARLAQGRRDETIDLLADARRRLALAPDPARLGDWLEEAEQASIPAMRDVAGIEPLSERELVVLRMLASDRSLREIAGELSVSPNTVKTQTKSLYRKLAVASREEAVARGRELRIVLN